LLFNNIFFKILKSLYLIGFISFCQNNEIKNLSFEDRADRLISKMTLAEKASQMVNSSKSLNKYEIDEYNWWNECLHGVARAGKATVFPVPLAMAATFDQNLIHNVANAISDEARAMYNISQSRGIKGQYSGLTFWSPNINIFRDPRWGRGYETYGEDPYLTSLMGKAFVKGLQGDHPKYLKVAACAKHYAVHSGPEKERHHFNAVVSKQDLYETYLPAFKELVNSNVEIVMCAYNKVNDEPCCGSNDLKKILRQDWDFKGHMVSDCGAINDISSSHGYKENNLESVAYAIKGGVDLNCGNLYSLIPKAVKAGLITENDVNASLKRLLMTRFKLGMFDEKGTVPYDSLGGNVINSKKHIQLAKEVAHKSIVLLKNKNNVLPLNKNIKSLFITGPNSSNIDALLGNYHGLSPNMITPLEGIISKIDNGTKVQYKLGVDLNSESSNIGPAYLAASSEVIISFMGISPLIEGEEGDAILSPANGDRIDLNFPKNQIDYIKKLRENAKNKPLILVIFGGSPIELGEVEPFVDAILYAWYPGEQGGNAIADIIFGDVNPSGRLPITFPKSVNQLPKYSDYSMNNRTYKYIDYDPMYPFGFGLSYSNFSYSNIKLNKTKIKIGEIIEASIDIENNSNKAGDEIAQIYISFKDKGYRVPNSKLIGLKRVKLKAGESKKIKFSIRPEDIQNIDQNGDNVFYKGKYKLTIGACSPWNKSSSFGLDYNESFFNIN
tara:strand:- start:48 stop:2222 length:2175 start_codon:yes stop_codon:yes gene_type:complete